MKYFRQKGLKLVGWFLCGLILSPGRGVHAGSRSQTTVDADNIVRHLQRAYEQIEAYQTVVEIDEYDKGRLVTRQRFRYAFQKPDRMRIDMETPHRGMRLVYPDEKGRVLVRFGGWMNFARLRLRPDNRLFLTRSGQRIDQSDFGLLIRNISFSVAEAAPGTQHVVERDGRLLLELVAPDHFLPEVMTRYRFVIDPLIWLPVAVEEGTPEGRMKRIIHFTDLKTDPVFPEHFFETDKEASADGS